MQHLERPLLSIAILLACLGSARVGDAQTGCDPGAVMCKPASLLLFPEIDDRQGSVEGFFDLDGFDYLVTVTNTSTSSGIDVEFVYIDSSACLEFNRTEYLTANDTLSVITRYHNPKGTRGYLYVFAKSPTTGQAVKFDHLIGDELVYEAEQFGDLDYSHKAFAFPAGRTLAENALTDLDADGVRDLNGFEYFRAPDKLLIPRFLGQASEGTPRSKLILVALSGGAAFQSTIVDGLLFNDNEELFSFQAQFYCWVKLDLTAISSAFTNDFLRVTNHAQNEILGWNLQEAGWLELDGLAASSAAEIINDPAILAVLVERHADGYAADLPFGLGSQNNGDLLPHSVFGDGSPIPVNGDNQ